jgi:hypothetical protein
MNTVPGIGLAYRNWNSLYFLPVKNFFKTKESGCLHGCYSYPQCSGSTTFLRGSGSADPCLWLMDPDPDHGSGSCNFCHWPWQQKIFYTICFACYFLKVHLHYFSKTKSQKESQNSRIQGFSYYFCMMIEGSGSRAGFGSIPSGLVDPDPELGGQKHVDPVDPDSDPKHCLPRPFPFALEGPRRGTI